ncbi:VOC family protein [Methylobacterium sp. 17Sr1-1]|uniref:VOC family protein n=1 Tax=Methylobacterium sp. 17Sr1-1 TaxID=2202826 RepID=UPI000D6F97B4|nr:VOC family protein [Methylobacterium sp. 17Sr1-1]AWN55495.1 glyoxalase [Methylobacterium sp. 17Sr1-1]
MHLASTRIITADVDRLVAFYEAVTGLSATRYTPDFAELRTTGATLAVGSTRTLALFGGDAVAQAAANRSAIIEFRVGDVDTEYARLAPDLGSALVQPPTTMPWGNRSLLLRDPDGTLVNLFAPVTAEAEQRLDQP